MSLAVTRLALRGACLVWMLLVAPAAEALDPEKRLTQYVHTSWRIQDGSLPAGMFSITQTSDGFLWLLSLPGDLYRFDGVQFVRWPVPSGPSGKVFADSAGGLWVTARELVHLKSGIVASQFELEGTHGFQSISEDPEGTVWVGLRRQDAPLCNASDHGVKCVGENDGLPLRDINAVLPDGSGGVWLGGPTALVRWKRGGVSETYPVKASITSLARTPDGTLWVGLFEEGPGLGLQALRDGVLKTFVTPHFDGSTVSVTSLMVDRDGSLWAGTDAAGVVRIHGDTAERYRQTDGLSGDSVWALFEDREGIVWAGTTSGIDSFRDPRVVTFSAVQGLGRTWQPGFWRAETAPSGWPTTGRSIASGTGRSHPSAGAMVFRGTKSPPCSKTAPAICGSESTTGCISSKMGDSIGCRNQTANRSEWSSD